MNVEAWIFGAVQSLLLQAAKDNDKVPAIRRGRDTLLFAILTLGALGFNIALAAYRKELTGVNWETTVPILWAALQTIGASLLNWWLVIKPRIKPGVISLVPPAPQT